MKNTMNPKSSHTKVTTVFELIYRYALSRNTSLKKDFTLKTTPYKLDNINIILPYE